MKRLSAIVLMGMGTAAAQDFIETLPEAEEISPVEVIEPRPSIEGIVKDIFTTKKPWQLVNPAAPKKYGTGEKLVSKDTGPGTPYHSTGLIVFGVEW